MPSTDQQLVLFCPRCDYNLTGLAENRCPECGELFDPVMLKQEVESTPKPIGFCVLIWSLLWPATAPWLLVGFGAADLIPQGTGSFFMLLLVFVTVASLLFQGIRVATLSKRLVVRVGGPRSAALRTPGGLVDWLAILMFLPPAVLTIAALFFAIGALGEL